MQKADEALKIADLALGTKQDSLNGMQKFGDLSLGKIETPGTKIYTPSYVFDFYTKLNLLPADRVAKDLAKAEEEASVQGHRTQGLPEKCIIHIHQ